MLTSDYTHPQEITLTPLQIAVTSGQTLTYKRRPLFQRDRSILAGLEPWKLWQGALAHASYESAINHTHERGPSNPDPRFTGQLRVIGEVSSKPGGKMRECAQLEE
ncbi:MAG: hypothetical protein N3G20_07745 [Verrucomicrobiae bacterium]|nr:hypothetical protein [Verrucomicrobiae bacterium]